MYNLKGACGADTLGMWIFVILKDSPVNSSAMASTYQVKILCFINFIFSKSWGKEHNSLCMHALTGPTHKLPNQKMSKLSFFMLCFHFVQIQKLPEIW